MREKKVAILFSQCIVSIIDAKKKSKLSIAKMVILVPELEVDSMRVVLAIIATKPLKGREKLKS